MTEAGAGVPTGTFGLLWTTPDADLWVANRDGEYAGLVEFTDGHFIARDSTGHILGTEVSVAAAKLLVRSQADAGTGFLGAVQQTLQRATESLSGSLSKPNPHYHRSV